MLDEKALRKPGFSEGYRVTLADSQEWTLPKPKIRFKPKVVDGKVEVGGARRSAPSSTSSSTFCLASWTSSRSSDCASSSRWPFDS